jgi:hypothetical protein
MEVETVLELWSGLRSFITKGDASAAADIFVATLDENGLLDVTKHTVLTIEDHALKDAIISYFDFAFDDEEEEEYE